MRSIKKKRYFINICSVIFSKILFSLFVKIIVTYHLTTLLFINNVKKVRDGEKWWGRGWNVVMFAVHFFKRKDGYRKHNLKKKLSLSFFFSFIFYDIYFNLILTVFLSQGSVYIHWYIVSWVYSTGCIRSLNLYQKNTPRQKVVTWNAILYRCTIE